MNRKNKLAFTLAETLLTLMILGVIATITIPSVQNLSKKRANVALAQKAYSTVGNATKEIKAENGMTRFWDISNVASATALYKQKIAVIGYPSKSYPIKALSGASVTISNFFTNGFISSDGMLWFVESATRSCNLSDTNMRNGCISLIVDVNGAKGPNTIGYDIFAFYVTADSSVYAKGGGPGVSPSTCARNSTGWGCSARIISENEIKW